MFFVCGVSAYSAAIFHLATHAFFKALLFLGAGSVIHAMHHQQDIQKWVEFGKNSNHLRHDVDWFTCTSWLSTICWFYSKDVILEAAFMSHSVVGKFAYIMGISAAFLTAFILGDYYS